MRRGGKNRTLSAIGDALRPRLADADDPTVAILVWGIGLCGAVLVGLSLAFGDEEIRSVGLTALGGVLLLLSAYFTARSLLYSSRAGFLNQFMRAAELLSDDDPVKRTAGRVALERLRAQARDTDDEAAITAVLDKDDDVPAARMSR